MPSCCLERRPADDRIERSGLTLNAVVPVLEDEMVEPGELVVELG